MKIKRYQLLCYYDGGIEVVKVSNDFKNCQEKMKKDFNYVIAKLDPEDAKESFITSDYAYIGPNPDSPHQSWQIVDFEIDVDDFEIEKLHTEKENIDISYDFESKMHENGYLNELSDTKLNDFKLFCISNDIFGEFKDLLTKNDIYFQCYWDCIEMTIDNFIKEWTRKGR